MIFYYFCHLYISFTLIISLTFFNIAFWTVFCSQCLCVSALTAWKKFQMVSQSARAHFIVIIVILRNSLALIHISRSVAALVIQQIIIFEVKAPIMNIVNLNLINTKIYQTILTAIIHQQHQVCLAQHLISIQYLISITAEIILINWLKTIWIMMMTMLYIRHEMILISH